MAFVILDGKVIPADRCKEKTVSVKGEVIDLWYPGKAHRHGGNIQGVARPDGLPLWVSAAKPGSVHDITAARIGALPALYCAAALGLTPWLTLEDGCELDLANRTRNAIQRTLRCLGERMFTLINQRWRTLQHITASPGDITGMARAVLVLTHFEHGYLK